MIKILDASGVTTTINYKTFPDGTLAIKLPMRKVLEIEWYYEYDAEMFALMCIRKHYANQRIPLFLPYVPNARMDRVKNSEDVFTLKYFCDFINSLDFCSVEVLDVHSNVATALLNNVVVKSPKDFIEKAIADSKADIVFFPDEGAMKRYSDMIDKPYAFGIKKRNWEDGKILGLEIMNKELIKDKNVLIIDDICSKGGTAYHSATALKEAGAKSVNLYITHCEATIFQGELVKSDIIDGIYTTDSIFKPGWAESYDKINVYNV